MLGVPFYVMDVARRRASSTDELPPVARHGRASGGAIGDELVDALVEIHAVDWRAAGLDGLRPAGRLPRAPGPPLLRPLGGERDARAAAGRRASRRWLGANRPESPAGDGRARRLPARQRHVRAGRRPRGCSPCSTGSSRRSATRSPTSATSSRPGREPGAPRDAARALAGHARSRGSRPRRSSSSATPSGRAVDVDEPAPGTRRSRSGRRPSSARRSTAATCAARRATRSAASLGEGVPALLEAAPTRPRACDRAARRLRRRPDDERLRVDAGLLQRPEGSSPMRSRTSSSRTRRPSPTPSARDRRTRRGRVREPAGAAARRRPEPPDLTPLRRRRDRAGRRGRGRTSGAPASRPRSSRTRGAAMYDRAGPRRLRRGGLSAEVGLRKPDPEIFLLAAERLGVEPAACVLVDDLRRTPGRPRRSG